RSISLSVFIRVHLWLNEIVPRVANPIACDEIAARELEATLTRPSTLPRLAMRIRIVLAAIKGSTNQQIAEDLGVSEMMVGKWRRAFARHGIEGLQDSPRSGRPPKAVPDKPPAAPSSLL